MKHGYPAVHSRLNLAHYRHLRAGLLADTHGYLDAHVSAQIETCDIAVHAGDIGAGQVLRALTPRLVHIVAVGGNNDIAAKWPAAERELPACLAETAVVELPGGRLVVVHGHRHNPASRRHQLLRRQFPQAAAILYGHSHRRIADAEAKPWVLNPGAAGKVRTYGGASCLILDASVDHWRLETVLSRPDQT